MAGSMACLAVDRFVDRLGAKPQRGGCHLWPQFTDVLATVPQGQIVSVINAVFANSLDDFKRQAAEAPPLPFLDRYMFNPLTARPFVRLRDDRLLAPVPQLITRKLSPMELYYLGSKRSRRQRRGTRQCTAVNCRSRSSTV